ncbi:MAG TPA: hypothetical protein VMW76_00290 [Bacteroidales bacterium]|nr:hypothetical protein [Bacteroidales bacterium]
MKTLLATSVFLFLLPYSVYSQQFIRDFMNLTEETVSLNKSVVNMPGYTGSPFLSSEFTEGSITASGGIIYEKVPLRYNIFNDIFEFEKDGIPYNLDAAKYGLKVSAGGQLFVFADYNYNKITNKGYLELLETGNFSLYKKYKVRYDRPEPAGAYTDTKPGNFFKLPSEYFLQEGENGEKKFITKESEFLELCGIHRQEVKTFMKNNRLKMKKESDLKEIVKFLNSL